MSKKLTTQEWKDKVEEKYPYVWKEYELLDEYINNTTKVRMKHLECGNVFDVKPGNFKDRGSRCPVCSHIKAGDKIRFSTESWKKLVKEINHNVWTEYELLSGYIGANTKVMLKHLTCGNTFEMNPNSFKNMGHRCPYCSGGYNYNTEEWKQVVEEKYPNIWNEYELLDDYTNSATKVKLKHLTCGNTFEMQPNVFQQGHRCAWCSNTHNYTTVEWKRAVEDKYPNIWDEYELLGEYVKSHDKVKMKHLGCGNTFEMTPSDFKSGYRCSWCGGTHSYTTEEWKQAVQDRYPDVWNVYELQSEYHKGGVKLKMKHLKCGYVFYVHPTSFKNGTICPYCRQIGMSKGEKLTISILERYNVNYEYQKYFENLKRVKGLSYDFYLPDYNMLIEYQGIQHYEPVSHFGGEEKFMVQQHHDWMKRNYDKDNGYELLEVPYIEDTYSKIEKVLLNNLDM